MKFNRILTLSECRDSISMFDIAILKDQSVYHYGIDDRNYGVCVMSSWTFYTDTLLRDRFKKMMVYRKGVIEL